MAFTFARTFTDKETIRFSARWKLKDGSDFPWADYTYAYAIESERGSPHASLTVENSGITVDPSQNLITFSAPVDLRLCAGNYRHGCVITHTETGQDIQFFVGPLTITEGV